VTLNYAIPCMTLGLLLLVGSGATQETPAAEKRPQQMPAEGSPQRAAPVAEEADPGATTIQSYKDKLSYAFGVDLGRDLRRQKDDLNLDLLMKALSDALAGNKLIITDEEVTATLKQAEANQKQDYAHAKAMIAAKNKKEGEAFFAENAKKDGVVTLPSGLQYRILKKGAGKTPTLDDHVVCNYRGTLLNGAEFDSSYKRGQPATLPVKGIIKGWAEALQLMPVGSKWQLFVPTQLAYGDKIVGGIGPDAMVIFEVELLSIEDKTQTASAAK
jgi:FKBP-type peptidyl-prolyl cis-trans isomerase FklB